jgi:V8-like Glu-specific endopeptidase
MRSWREWHNADAIVDGDAVEIQLVVAPGESGVFFTIEGILVPDEPGGDPVSRERSLCNNDDSRTPSGDPRVGRLFSSGCTGWLIGNNAVLTAGHCVIGGTLSGVLEFNVPPSTTTGNMVPAAAVDRYPVISSSLAFEDGGESHDWAVFSIGPNAVTGLAAHDVQGVFKVTTVVPSNGSTLRLTGYGIDNAPLGPGGTGAACCATDGENCEFNCNSASQTQQTSTGRLDDLDGSRIEHQVDSLPGNSGGPIIRESNFYTIGIHTHGGCDSFFSDFDNGGTWFGYAPLFNAINSFTPPSTRFVDLTSPDSIENGGILRPFDTVFEAVANVPDGGVIRIFAGSYTAAVGNAISIGADGRAIRLEAVLGTVTIGN